jgi:PAS domain S-box-containing protein
MIQPTVIPGADGRRYPPPLFPAVATAPAAGRGSHARRAARMAPGIARQCAGWRPGKEPKIASEEPPSHERLLWLLLEQSRDHALILLDPDGVVVGWYAAAEDIFGYTRAEILGQRADRIFIPEDCERGVPAHELEVARADGRAEDDRWQLRKDGSRFWASGVVTPLREGQRLVGFGKVLRDRTDVKARIDASDNRLAALVAVDERKNLFLATLGHELRSPLSPLVNAIELLRLASLPASAEAPLRMMERQVASLRRLVDDLLDVARIGAGKVRLEVRELRLDEVLHRAADSVRADAERQEQRFSVLLLPSPVYVDGDPDRLHQVFVNLLANAIKYTPRGGQIWLKETVEGSEAVVRVEDDGVGISPEVLPRIFELFTQEESSLPLSAGGLGLGLPLVRELVSLHGGTVQVRSEGKDKGSELSVRLPLRPTPGDPPDRP